MTDDEELDDGGEVSQPNEEPRHHIGSLRAACLLHKSHGVLWVFQFVQEMPHRGVKVPSISLALEEAALLIAELMAIPFVFIFSFCLTLIGSN